jgi:hypothetical protein
MELDGGTMTKLVEFSRQDSLDSTRRQRMSMRSADSMNVSTGSTYGVVLHLFDGDQGQAPVHIMISASRLLGMK